MRWTKGIADAGVHTTSRTGDRVGVGVGVGAKHLIGEMESGEMGSTGRRIARFRPRSF